MHTLLKSVTPRDTNYYGKLNGGVLSMWIDESAWVFAKDRYSKLNFYTKKIEIEYMTCGDCGDIVEIRSEEGIVGTTSLTYEKIEAYNKTQDRVIACAKVVMVCVDEDGNKNEIEGKVYETKNS